MSDALAGRHEVQKHWETTGVRQEDQRAFVTKISPKALDSAKATEPNLAVGRKPQANAFFPSPRKTHLACHRCLYYL